MNLDELTSITSVRLSSGVSGVTGMGRRELLSLPCFQNLSKLIIRGLRWLFLDQRIELLSHLPNLKSLFIYFVPEDSYSQTRFINFFLTEISGLSQLEELGFNGDVIGAKTFQLLSNFPNLHSLHIDMYRVAKTRIDICKIKWAKKLKKLTQLHLYEPVAQYQRDIIVTLEEVILQVKNELKLLMKAQEPNILQNVRIYRIEEQLGIGIYKIGMFRQFETLYPRDNQVKWISKTLKKRETKLNHVLRTFFPPEIANLIAKQM